MYVMWCDVEYCYVLLCYVMSYYVIYYVISWYFMLFYVSLSFSIIANILHRRAQAEVHALQDAELVFAGEPLVPWCHKPTMGIPPTH